MTIHITLMGFLATVGAVALTVLALYVIIGIVCVFLFFR